MKRSITSNRLVIFAIAAVAAVTLFSCRTSEANYQRAYELAKQAKSEPLDSTIYARIRNEARNESAVIGGDTIAMKRELVSQVKLDGVELPTMLRFNLVAGSFKQLFHAKSMRKRISEAGYPEAIIVQTREPYYYVVAATSDDVRDLIPLMQRLQAEPPIRLADDHPWILRAY